MRTCIELNNVFDISHDEFYKEVTQWLHSQLIDIFRIYEWISMDAGILRVTSIIDFRPLQNIMFENQQCF